MNLLVVDASALTLFLVGADDAATEFRQYMASHRLAAPHGSELHCAAQLHTLVHIGTLAIREADDALALLGRLELHRYPHRPLIPRVWELLPILGPEEAACVALAELLNCELITAGDAYATADSARCPIRTPRPPAPVVAR